MPKPCIAIIGGSGLYSLENLCPITLPPIKTPYAEVAHVQADSATQPQVIFLPRHGPAHKTPPHKINYRANIYALHALGATQVIAINAVGSMVEEPGSWIIPNQIIDYTWGREHSFAEDFSQQMLHIDFTNPFNQPLSEAVFSGLKPYKEQLILGGTYGCTQGPRLETAAEIRRMENDGCHLVGMTLMPEAALAAELSLAYASVCISVNWAAGKSAGSITMEQIGQILSDEQTRLRQALPSLIITLLQNTG
jgi:5'-methylthioinosine phosphorylase